jgi:hypothetical protein
MDAARRAGLSDAALAMSQPIIDALLQDICRRIKGAGAITDTAEYQIYRAKALGAADKEIKKAVAEQLKIQAEVIDSLFADVLDNTLAYDDGGQFAQIAAGYSRITAGKSAETLKSLWAAAPDGTVVPVQDAYARCMDFAFRTVTTGADSLDGALRKATAQLARRGVRTIEQKSGRSVGIEYACRRYIMDQCGALTEEITQASHDALDCDGWEIDAHPACAPDHAAIQGRQFTDAEYEALENSLQRRIGHLNCGHTAYPIKLGVDKAAYSPEKLAQYAAENKRGVTCNGRHYTLYEAGQEQATLENGIRLIKRQCLTDAESGCSDLQKHQIKLRVVQGEYARFCKGAGLQTRSERLQVAGFGHSAASKATWAYKRVNGGKLLDSSLLGHTVYSVTDKRISLVKKPYFRCLSNNMNEKAQKFSRTILESVKGMKDGTEATLSFSVDGKSSTTISIGPEGEMRVNVERMDTPYIALHNHAGNGILSPKDIYELIQSKNMVGIAAIGNAGALYTCEKAYGYSKSAMALFKHLVIKYPKYRDSFKEQQKFMDELLMGGEKVGLHFN